MNLQFNLSHSGGLALYAITQVAEVGIDVERLRLLVEAEDIAQRYFSFTEYTILEQMPAPVRTEGFFHLWTRKEAILKACGKGLVQNMSQIDVSWSAEEPIALLEMEDDEQRPGYWTLMTIEPAPGYVGAIAVPGQGWKTVYMEWDADTLSAAGPRSELFNAETYDAKR